MTYEKDVVHTGDETCSFYSDGLKSSAEFRKGYRSRLKVVKADDMPFENSPDGLLKHLVHERLDTSECCMDIYMQFIPPSQKSGRHRHLAEELFYVAEGTGYDLHWDVNFECKEEFEWSWNDEPRRYEWKQGDFVFIPAYCIHQHFNSNNGSEARIIVMHNRIFKAMGLDWYDQLENADEYEGEPLTGIAGPGWETANSGD